MDIMENMKKAIYWKINDDLVFRTIPKRINTGKYFVIHHDASKKCSVLDIHQWHLSRGFYGFGYNCFIEKTGQINFVRYIDMETAAVKSFNTQAYSVCLEGDFRYEIATNKQIYSLCEVYEWYLKTGRQGILKLHKELQNDTDCPARFNKKSFESDFKLYMNRCSTPQAREFEKYLIDYTNDSGVWRKYFKALEKGDLDTIGKMNVSQNCNKYICLVLEKIGRRKK